MDRTKGGNNTDKVKTRRDIDMEFWHRFLYGPSRPCRMVNIMPIKAGSRRRVVQARITVAPPIQKTRRGLSCQLSEGQELTKEAKPTPYPQEWSKDGSRQLAYGSLNSHFGRRLT